MMHTVCLELQIECDEYLYKADQIGRLVQAAIGTMLVRNPSLKIRARGNFSFDVGPWILPYGLDLEFRVTKVDD